MVAARRQFLDALRPWYEAGLPDRQRGVEVAGGVVKGGIGAITEGVVNELDLDEIIDSVDIDGIVSRLELSNIVLQSTGGIAGETLDFARGVGRSADTRVQSIVDRVLRRRQELSAAEGT